MIEAPESETASISNSGKSAGAHYKRTDMAKLVALPSLRMALGSRANYPRR